MSSALTAEGPLEGLAIPVHGGKPDSSGCNGCIDCCHLPEISLTDEEAARIRDRYSDLPDPAGALVLTPDAGHPGWQIMHGPCVFRRHDRALEAGGCRIYADRPSACAIFTCQLLLELRRRV